MKPEQGVEGREFRRGQLAAFSAGRVVDRVVEHFDIAVERVEWEWHSGKLIVDACMHETRVRH